MLLLIYTMSLGGLGSMFYFNNESDYDDNIKIVVIYWAFVCIVK